MTLHTLGRTAGPEAGGACSGYLLEIGGRRILLDCGPGVAGGLLSVLQFEALDAILISHLHHDHFFDLFALTSGLSRRFLTTDPSRRLKRIPLFVPPGGRAILERVADAVGYSGHGLPEKPGAATVYHELRALVEEAGSRLFALLPCTEYQFEVPFDLDGASVLPRQADHSVPAASFRLTTESLRFVYSGDTAFHPGLIDLARDADLFLCEATEPSGEAPFRWHGGHLSASEAGRVAAEAGARRLVLTHFHADADQGLMVADARASFSGQLLIATPGEPIDVVAARHGARSSADDLAASAHGSTDREGKGG